MMKYSPLFIMKLKQKQCFSRNIFESIEIEIDLNGEKLSNEILK